MRIVPKALLTGIFINFGSLLGVSLFYNMAVYLFQMFISNIKMIPTEPFYQLLEDSAIINWGMTIICCAITLFGAYLAARMARGSEWLNGMGALVISLAMSYAIGWDATAFETIAVVLIALFFGFLGCFIATNKNKREV